MLVRMRKPTAPLSAMIEYYWYMEDAGPQDLSGRKLTLPDGSCDLVVDLRADRIHLEHAALHGIVLGSAIVIGPHSQHYVIRENAPSAVMGVRFKPGGAFPFIRLPMGDLHNALVSLSALWGGRAEELRFRLLQAETVEAKFQTMENVLQEFSGPPREMSAAVRYALNALDGASKTMDVGAVAERTGLSHRRLIELFKAEVGMTPKRYSRIRRFRQVLDRIHDGHGIDWADIALSCGYFDQSHFIREFQAFSGINPRDYPKLAGRHPRHVSLPDRKHRT